MRRASSRAGRDELNLENLMTDICISTALIIAAFAWYLIARRFPIVPQGPKYLRGSVGVGLVMYAAYATVVYANQYTPDSWSTAFVGVAIVLLHVLLAMVVAFMLWTMKKECYISVAISISTSREPEE